MQSLNDYCKPYFDENSLHWLSLSSSVGSLSHSIVLQDKKMIEENILVVFEHIFSMAYGLNIDLDKSWSKWQKKAAAKKYVSRSISLEANMNNSNGSPRTTNSDSS
tara:strand:+ start:1832 stop:2149 length:318 start_codon:yes stop_codon:yes gene_type:complete